MFSDRAGMSASTCVLLSLTKCCASSLLPNGITECPAPKPLSGALIQRRMTNKLYHSWDFHNVLLSQCALPSHLETLLILIFFSHAFVMAVFRHPLAFGVLLVCLLLQPHACNASSRQDVAKCLDQLLQADVAFWEDAKVWLLLTTTLCVNAISLGERLVWTRSTAFSIPGERCQANHEKERQQEEIWKTFYETTESYRKAWSQNI